MAESYHTEHAPLLGASSPTHTSPAPMAIHAPPPAPHDPLLPPWPPDHPWGLEGHAHRTKVRSQSSMDSGCECDDGPPPTPHPHPPQPGLSPLSPSQPGGSGPPTPGTSEGAPGGVSTGGTVPDGASKVTFSFDGDDDDDDDDDDDRCSAMGGLMVPRGAMNAIESASLSGSEPGEGFREQILHHSQGFPRVPSYSKTGVLSSSSSTASMPMCRICHHPQGDGLDTLISPCRCAGTMQFIHQGCLNKWLEVKRCKKAPVCELCNYQFHRHKKFRVHHWQLPSCTRADKILHSIFLVCLVVMATCATITIICFKQVTATTTTTTTTAASTAATDPPLPLLPPPSSPPPPPLPPPPPPSSPPPPSFDIRYHHNHNHHHHHHYYNHHHYLTGPRSPEEG
ncbi:E3 ubiquitin-protein ligase MARCHF11-like isoform X3 [Portunus trituberculatus]|uniref:E3 ubiquitin-protein ligase MARCHF11-like isoform X3 n=1 Tax=Portunus trituberculatus TaxID=210409 RepID=UPI001E1D1EE7|nr:E3 ubiquitin-protein ligase MARCHF11-like isoform X3 [Portunus trituberculatus]